MKMRWKDVLEPKRLVKVFLAFIVIGIVMILGINGFVKVTSKNRIATIEQLEKENEGTEEQIDAEALGVKAKGVTCDIRVYRGDRYRKLREVAARIKDVGITITKPKPTYLGDAIPVSGNGDVTNDKQSVLLD